MFFRLMLTLNLTDQDALDDIIDKVKDHQDAAITINPGQPNAEPSYYQTHKCFHDLSPTQQCEVLDNWQSPNA